MQRKSCSVIIQNFAIFRKIYIDVTEIIYLFIYLSYNLTQILDFEHAKPTMTPTFKVFNFNFLSKLILLSVIEEYTDPPTDVLLVLTQILGTNILSFSIKKLVQGNKKQNI